MTHMTIDAGGELNWDVACCSFDSNISRVTRVQYRYYNQIVIDCIIWYVSNCNVAINQLHQESDDGSSVARGQPWP